MRSIDEIKRELLESEIIDSEGDRTWRVHIITAMRLIDEAYSAPHQASNPSDQRAGEVKP